MWPDTLYNILKLLLFVNMASRQLTLTNTIHLQDFVDDVVDNPTRPDISNYIENRTDVNIFEENRFYSSDVVVEPIHARIRTYVTQAEREL
jgi:hypothetical protein